MSFLTREVVITDEAIKKLFKARAIDAISEGIWNSIDAGAKNIDIKFTNSEVFNKIVNVEIVDDGEGMPYEKFEECFLQYQKSWKANESNKDGQYHGCRGEGRFKLMSIAKNLQWDITYQSGAVQQYTVNAERTNPKKFNLSSPKASKLSCGTKLTLYNLTDKAEDLNSESIYFDLVAIFALYLRKNKNLTITVDDTKLNPEDFIFDEKNGSFDIDIDSSKFNIKYNFIAWKEEFKFNDNKHAYFFDNYGNYIFKKPSGVQGNIVKHSVFLSSEYFVTFDGLHEEIQGKVDKIRNKFKSELVEFLYQIRKKQCAVFHEKFEKEKYYPFNRDTANPVESALKDVFDVCTLKIIEQQPQLIKKQTDSLTILFKLLRKLIEYQGDIGSILSEVIGLSEEETQRFASLLNSTSMPSLISHYEEIVRKLTFLDVLEEIAYGDSYKKKFKERSQLHKIIEKETWIFGEEFEKKVGTSDKGLDEVIRQHMKVQDFTQDEIQKALDNFSQNKKDDELLRLIPDLYLYHDFRVNNGQVVRNLVVELKAPNVKIGDNEINQIQSQRKAIQRNTRYKVDVNNKWSFFVVSSEIKNEVSTEFSTDEFGNKVLYKSDDGNFVAYCKTWDEIIRASKTNLAKEKERLAVKITSAEKDKLLDKYLKDVGFVKP